MVADNQNSPRANPRGPALLEDFILREKITHIDHERIAERIVHVCSTAPRDLRGFAIKCYVSQGNLGLVGNNFGLTADCRARYT